jgi:hypothetical protein
MSHDPLENPIHQLLHNLPDRPAPATLEARVMATIAARESLVWWKRPFMQWPAFWRGLFLVISVLIAVAGVTGFLILHRQGSGHFLAAIHFGPWLETVTLGRAFVTIGHALHIVGDALPSLVPRDWILAGAAAYAAVLLMILGSYRMLARSA